MKHRGSEDNESRRSIVPTAPRGSVTQQGWTGPMRPSGTLATLLVTMTWWGPVGGGDYSWTTLLKRVCWERGLSSRVPVTLRTGDGGWMHTVLDVETEVPLSID